jgi:hypothetical protein
MPDLSFKRLIFRGHYEIVCDVDFSESLLSARYAGGYREDVVIGLTSGLRSWKLKYSPFNKRILIDVPDVGPMARDDYIWNDFCESKAGGNIPRIITCPRDGKDYLFIYKDDRLSFTLVDQFLRTTGLQIEQCYVRGTNTLPDGSLGDSTNPSEI